MPPKGTPRRRLVFDGEDNEPPSSGTRSRGVNQSPRVRRGGSPGKSLPPGGRQRKAKKPKRRFKPGTVALREIRRFQGNRWVPTEEGEEPINFRSTGHETKLIIPMKPFLRVVREIAQQIKSDLRWNPSAILVLQHVSEAMLVRYFQNANICAISSARQTIKVRDVRLGSKLDPMIPKPMRHNFHIWLRNNPGCYCRAGGMGTDLRGNELPLSEPLSLWRLDGVSDGLYGTRTNPNY